MIAAAVGLLLMGVLALGMLANWLVAVVAFWAGLPMVVMAAVTAVGGVALVVGLWAVLKRR